MATRAAQAARVFTGGWRDVMESDFIPIARTGAGAGVVFSREERERHLYVVGKSGSGKSTFLYNLAMGDIPGRLLWERFSSASFCACTELYRQVRFPYRRSSREIVPGLTPNTFAVSFWE